MAMILKKVERPRELKWYQAGAMLYGDWGTSKAYVIGIAFVLAGHVSWFFLGLISCLTMLVGLCYIIVCRMFPDGGGVYSSVKTRSKPLALIGAFLLIASYTITASLSALNAFQYLRVPNPELWAIGALALIGAINWLGPSKGGNVATVVAVLASIAAAVLCIFTIPSLRSADLQMPSFDLTSNWSVFVGIVLAISGAEAIANMTGIMKRPVETTAKRAIWPVMLEVSLITFILGIAMNSIPGLSGHAEDMLRVLADHYVGPWYGNVISVLFALLLLSAANTAISGFVSVQFVLAKDKELPAEFARLNRFGMPGLALLVATVIPAFVLVLEHDLIRLAALYAIGVVGAIALNLSACATHKEFPLKSYERALLFCGAVLLFCIEITIAFQKPHALLFAVIVIGSGLALSYLGKKVLPVAIPEVMPTVNLLTVSEAQEIAPLYKSSTLVALRALNPHLLEEAALRTKALGENSVYLSFVEEAPPSSELPVEIEPSSEAMELLSSAQAEMEKKGITAIPVWQMGEDPGRLIAHAAKELGVNTVMIGTTRRSAITNLVRGDVLRTLARRLPHDCHLVISG